MGRKLISLKCECGSVEGELTINKSLNNHVVCCCDDCQTYAQYLGRKDLLDKFDGTELFQTAPRYIKITKGQEHLSCLRLSPKGLYRWYAGCCNFPMVNTLGAKIPFNGLVCAFVTGDKSALGDIQSYNMMKFSSLKSSEWPKNGFEKFSKLAGLFILKLLSLGTILRLTKPNSFFDLDSGLPKVEPQILSKEERDYTRSKILHIDK
ncbi:DUF6151 family protein [Halobacteriovorax sp. RT-2-6]|uniref:DUF6151 family protein n=1 Tax=unclassified Halobacteriovorax TaxID=2639665 RepID=UPI00399BAED7